MKNLLKFVRLHKGLNAAQRDWELVFGAGFRRTLANGKLLFDKGDSICQVMDELRPGEMCEVYPEYGMYRNSRYAEDAREFTEINALTPTRLTFQSFAKEIARALSLDVHKVTQNEIVPNLLALRLNSIPIYLSLATTVSEMQRHIDNVIHDKDCYILSLLDFSSKIGYLQMDSKTRLTTISHFVNQEEQTMVLHSVENVSIIDECKTLQNPTKHYGALCKRPPEADYSAFHFKVITISDDINECPYSDLFTCWYDGQSEPKPRLARSIPEFCYDAKTLGDAWLMVRHYALREGVMMPSVSKKTQHNRSQMRSGVLTPLLNKIAGMPEDEKPFYQAGKKRGSRVRFKVHNEVISQSVYLSRYSSTEYQDYLESHNDVD